MLTQKKINSQFTSKQESGIIIFELLYDCRSEGAKRKSGEKNRVGAINRLRKRGIAQ